MRPRRPAVAEFLKVERFRFMTGKGAAIMD